MTRMTPSTRGKWLTQSNTPYGEWARSMIAQFVEHDVKIASRRWAMQYGMVEQYDQAVEQYNRETGETK